MRLIPLFLLLALPALAARGAAPTGNDLVKTELLADHSAIRPGQTFTVGVRFTIAPHWHIYWLNPGDAGEATKVRFDLPPGFKAEPLQFPFPHEFHDPGDITAYGYQSEVVLIATIHAPKELSVASDVTIRAKSDWLVCEKICLPGEASNELTLHVASTETPANRELFEKTKHSIPRHSTEFQVKATRDGDGLNVAFAIPMQSTSGTWHILPGPADAVVLKDVSVTSDSSTVRGKFRIEPLPGAAVRQETLLCLLSNMDRTDGLTFDVPLRELWSTTAEPTTKPARP